ncbi:carboxylesterase/lipase family protein [[Erwinia] mediterraneensis]|uniref:carboxylesterase/lipase family protein n=1 Tax=[Erwinia] mediterraneensis TaxID=2161819 RepID=UPI00103213A3|nr:carboxylesterase/lipase family protein [[Erwinia] mediterraneensis]
MKNQRHLKLMTAEGEVRGAMDDNLFVFRGLPYAAPPVGALRWRPPQPMARWQGVRDAIQWGNACWQNREYCINVGGGDPGVFSEDCLYLNIWTPDITPSRPLPVMVWLHGGGFTLGAGSLPPYNGRYLAGRGVVVVTLNYRLGHLGFFAHPALDSEYPEGKTVNNFALLDQIAALQWIQRNIPAFGGDRHNVTLFGESSGARSILSLYCSPLAQGLFNKGIVQSAYSLPDVERRQALNNGIALAKHFGLENATAEELRRLPAEAFWSLGGELATQPVPIVGDTLLPRSMLATFRAGQQQRLPLIIGSNSDEASVLDYFGIDVTRIIREMRAQRPLIYRLVKWLYDIHDDTLLGRALARDMAFSALTTLVVQAQHDVGMPGWRYWFDYVSEHARDSYPHGSWHGSEIPYVFNTLSQLADVSNQSPANAADDAFARNLSAYWIAFARDASEFTHTLPGELPWPAWHPGDDLTLAFGEGGKGGLRLKRNFMQARMRLCRLMMHSQVRLS